MMGAVTWKAPDVQRPEGPLTGPERPMLQAFLDSQRATLLYKCAGLTGEQMADTDGAAVGPVAARAGAAHDQGGADVVPPAVRG